MTKIILKFLQNSSNAVRKISKKFSKFSLQNALWEFLFNFMNLTTFLITTKVINRCSAYPHPTLFKLIPEIMSRSVTWLTCQHSLKKDFHGFAAPLAGKTRKNFRAIEFFSVPIPWKCFFVRLRHPLADKMRWMERKTNRFTSLGEGWKWKREPHPEKHFLSIQTLLFLTFFYRIMKIISHSSLRGVAREDCSLFRAKEKCFDQ